MFVGNAAVLGSGMDNFESGPVLENVIFTSNTATAGAGVHNFDSTPYFENVIASSPDDEAVLYHLGISYFRTGKFPEAVEMFRKSVKLNPEDNRSKKMLEFMLNVSEI